MKKKLQEKQLLKIISFAAPLVAMLISAIFNVDNTAGLEANLEQIAYGAVGILGVIGIVANNDKPTDEK